MSDAMERPKQAVIQGDDVESVAAGQTKTAGKVLIGTVAGDMHNLGKAIVVAMLAVLALMSWTSVLTSLPLLSLPEPLSGNRISSASGAICLPPC